MNIDTHTLLKNKFLLLGLGKSNQSVMRFFIKMGVSFQVYDDKGPQPLQPYDIIIKSPGITNDHHLIAHSKAKIISDLELFYLLSNNKIMITVTGTNGKTTTVSLIKAVLEKYDLGGNIGEPLFDFYESANPIIIEASSFMLEYTEQFRSKYNCLLNITPNHLDHHLNYAEYINSKVKLINNLSLHDYLIYNHDDLLIRKLAKKTNCIKIPFSLVEEVEGCYYKSGYIYLGSRAIIDIREIKLYGKHNIANILCAIIIGYLNGANVYHIRQVVKTFYQLEHRIEKVGDYNNITIYNDSKSTNYQALRSALKSFIDKKIILICGGKSGSEDVHVLNDALDDIVEVRLVGENKVQLKNYFEGQNIKTKCYDSLDNILNNIDDTNANVILFSPGATSFDMYKNYQERGKKFKEIAKKSLKMC